MAKQPQRCLFLLLRSFAPMYLSNAVAALYAANRHSNSKVFEWQVISETGARMTAVNGLEVGVDSGLIAASRNDIVFVCGGEGRGEEVSRDLLGWLRKARRVGATLVAFGSATRTFAEAGFLDDRPASVHWLQRAVIEDAYPSVEVSSSIFTMEMRIITCAGGAATLDMMLELISRLHTQDLAIGVADRLICSSSRTEDYDQTLSEQRRAGVRHEKLSQALQLMQERLEDPLPQSEIAAEVGLSTRQLERLFSRYLKSSPKAYYVKRRLERARTLLQQTNMRVIDISVACGFTSQSHFSKVYRKHFGTSPHHERGVSSAMD